MLKDAYGNKLMRLSKATFYRWFNRFPEENEQVEDEPRSEAPKNARKKENIQVVEKLALKDRRSSVKMISEAIGISVGTVDTILTNDLKLHKVCAEDPPQGPETVSYEMLL